MSTQEEKKLLLVEKAQVANVMGIPCISLNPLGSVVFYKVPATLWVPIEYWTRLSKDKPKESLLDFIRKACEQLDKDLMANVPEHYGFNGQFTKDHFDFPPKTNIIVLFMDSFHEFIPMLTSFLSPGPIRMNTVSSFSSPNAFTCAISSSEENTPKRLDTLLVIASRDAFFAE